MLQLIGGATVARKDLLKSVLNPAADKASDGGRTNYAMRGASKSMKVSIDSLAEDARRMMDGETIVEISPDLIDSSFVSDRLGLDDEAFQELKASIAAGQQDTPVLLRPHPNTTGRFMVVFGHRRVRAAAELERMVRAVVKPMDDVAHILAQGHENTARADLSFIEKAVFARNLADIGQPKDVIMSALTVDGTLLSRMLSVTQQIPRDVIDGVGPAKQIGRDRWEGFKKLMAEQANIKLVQHMVAEPSFAGLQSDARFELLLSKLSEKGRAVRKKTRRAAPAKRTWTANGGRIKGVVGKSGKAFNVSLTSTDASEFGDYLAGNLDGLYEAFLSAKQEKTK
nr:plasmid partitioning protein RepB [Roseovarius sp. M141]